MVATSGSSLEVEVRYTRQIVAGAVRTFVGRRLRERWGIGVMATALALTAAWLGRSGPRWLTVIYAIIALLPVVLALVIWFAQHVYKLKALRRMGEPVAVLTLADDGLFISSGAGTAKLRYAHVEHVWRRPDCWLLVLGTNRFIVLPSAGLPAPWLTDLDERLVKARAA